MTSEDANQEASVVVPRGKYLAALGSWRWRKEKGGEYRGRNKIADNLGLGMKKKK